MSGILIQTLRNIYRYLGDDDIVIDDNAVFQEPRMSRHNPTTCDLCFPIIRHRGYDVSVSAVLLFPEYKNFKMKIDIEKVQRELPDKSKSWIVPIKLCTSSPNSLCVVLDHTKAFQVTINQILAKETFLEIANLNKTVFLSKDSGLETLQCADLTKLRTVLAFQSLRNVFLYLGYTVEINGHRNGDYIAEDVKKFHICHKSMCSEKQPDYCLIQCGAVLDKTTGAKASNICPDDYYRNKTAAFEKLAEGRGNSVKNNHQEKTLSEAEVVAELLWVKLHDNVSISISQESEETTGVARGATFLLYNHVRLTCIRKKFCQEVDLGNYERLPGIEHVDFQLLSQNEEWDLLLLVLQFPSWLIQCVSPKGKVSLHPLLVGLDKICRTFSVYYRRVRVLTVSQPTFCVIYEL